MPTIATHSNAFDQVRQAKARYCRYLDTKQWNSFADLFIPVPNITMYDEAGALVVVYSARDDFIVAARDYLEGARSIHQVHNDELTQVSDREIGAIWSMEDYILFPESENGRPSRHHGYGHYYETWVLTSEGWRIANLELRRTILEIMP